jgi:putative ABC transport system permease protein
MSAPPRTPPPLAAWLAARMARYETEFLWADDLAEEFRLKAGTQGIRRARLWYRSQVLRSLPAYTYNLFRWSATMLKNYLLTAFRNVRKHKAFTAINVIGLSFGLAGSLLILVHIRSELSYDRFHRNAKNIYRIIMDQRWNNWQGRSLWNIAPGALAPAAEAGVPGVERAARARFGPALISVGEMAVNESAFLFADPGFLDIFDFPLVSGNRTTALNEPYSVLITRDASRKYFGSDDPIGRTINVNKSADFKVTGVLENVPRNSHLQFDFLASFSTFYSQWGRDGVEDWGSNSFQTYLRLAAGQDPASVASRLTALLKSHKSKSRDEDFILQPLTRIHLHSAMMHDDERGNIKHIHFLAAIAAILILLAVFNFINLSTAQASVRMREVGMRKVVGADRACLVRQFLGEALGFTVAAFVLALVLVRLAFPMFNTLVRRNLPFAAVLDPAFLLWAAALVLVVGLLAGFYPAVCLASFRPASLFWVKAGTEGRGATRFRDTLVVLQFMVSIVLVVGTLVIQRQLSFMRNRDLGFISEQVLNIPIQDPGLRRSPDPVRRALEEIPGVRDILCSQDIPTTISSNSTFTNPPWAGPRAASSFYINWGWVDEGFFDFYGIPIVRGRSFSRAMATDRKAYVINETAARIIGWDDPVGRMIRDTPIIGVVKDFHFRSLREEIEPMALALNEPGNIRYFSAKLSGDGLEDTLSALSGAWKKYSPGYPFIYSFLDERLARLYSSERLLLKTFNLFAGLAIALSAMGLFGLALFTAGRRTREIGIRKVLGASVPSILSLLASNYLRWILLANVLACPVAFVFMKRWLQGFAYRASLPFWIFLAAASLSLVVASFSVGFQSWRAARANPTDSLRHE